MKAFPITNGEHVHYFSDRIKEYCEMVNIPGLHAANLETMLCDIAQYGNGREFWVVFDESERPTPLGFASWNVSGAPMVSTVFCSVIYSWSKNPQVVDLLIDQFYDFAKRCNAVWLVADFLGEARARLFKNRMGKHGFEIHEDKSIKCFFRRRKDELRN